MNIKGKVIAVLQETKGTSASGKDWVSQQYVIETLGAYPDKVCFTVFGQDKINEFKIKEGEVIDVHFNLSSREYNSRWYHDIRAWRIERDAVPTTAAPALAPAPTHDVAPKGDDDLPF